MKLTVRSISMLLSRSASDSITLTTLTSPTVLLVSIMADKVSSRTYSVQSLMLTSMSADTTTDTPDHGGSTGSTRRDDLVGLTVVVDIFTINLVGT